MRFFHVYHESFRSRAARALDVRPCHWIKQAVCGTEEEARALARFVAAQHRVHCKVTCREGTVLFPGRPEHA